MGARTGALCRPKLGHISIFQEALPFTYMRLDSYKCTRTDYILGAYLLGVWVWIWWVFGCWLCVKLYNDLVTFWGLGLFGVVFGLWL